MLSDNYKCIQGYECLVGCLSNYFNYYNIDVNESDIFLCGDGFNIEYSGDLQYLRIGTKAYEAGGKFIKKYKIPCKNGFMSDSEEAVKMAEYCIGKDIPLTVRVNTGRLSYHSVYHNSPPSPHWINVIGGNNGGYIISDCAIPSLKRENIAAQITGDELMSAWEALRYEYIVFDKEKLYETDRERIKRDSRDRLLRAFEEYIRPKRKWFRSTRQGIDAVTSLFDDIVSCLGESREELDYIIREINYQVKLKGIISYRYVVKKKLMELGLSDIYVKEFDGITDRWNNLFFKLLRAGMTGQQEELERIRDEAYAVKGMEESNIRNILCRLQ